MDLEKYGSILGGDTSLFLPHSLLTEGPQNSKGKAE
jgi:hypothetical protein